MKYSSPLPREIEELATTTVDAAYKIHVTLGPGLLESVYEVCLAHELRQRGLQIQTQVEVPVVYSAC